MVNEVEMISVNALIVHMIEIEMHSRRLVSSTTRSLVLVLCAVPGHAE